MPTGRGNSRISFEGTQPRFGGCLRFPCGGRGHSGWGRHHGLGCLGRASDDVWRPATALGPLARRRGQSISRRPNRMHPRVQAWWSDGPGTICTAPPRAIMVLPSQQRQHVSIGTSGRPARPPAPRELPLVDRYAGPGAGGSLVKPRPAKCRPTALGWQERTSSARHCQFRD